MGNRHGNPALCVAFFSSCLFLLSRPCRHLAGRPFFLEGGLDFCSPTFLSSSRSLASTLQALYLISFVTLLSPTPFLKFSLVRPLCRQKIGFFCQKKKKGNIFLGACVGLHARRQDDDKRAFDADDEPQRKNRKRPRKTTSPQKKDALFSCLDLSWFFPASKCLVLSRFFHRYILVRRKKLRRDFGSCCRRARASQPTHVMLSSRDFVDPPTNTVRALFLSRLSVRRCHLFSLSRISGAFGVSFSFWVFLSFSSASPKGRPKKRSASICRRRRRCPRPPLCRFARPFASPLQKHPKIFSLGPLRDDQSIERLSFMSPVWCRCHHCCRLGRRDNAVEDKAIVDNEDDDKRRLQGPTANNPTATTTTTTTVDDRDDGKTLASVTKEGGKTRQGTMARL
ncbi:hypothetical protein pclt_cds_1204 [Pandoravirus celtis]|uniref:Uncharacterized protein n=1 Tax=Pandoravirus celtis TaxID=2568002 RepID=A0A4D6EKD6_9VIRU|nr:hypothetical protein pclt_cds_1204 [Pandoravirus celtis]